MAGVLCVGGPIKYKFKSGVTISDDWLFEHVVPNIRRRFPQDSRLCRVLGTALLFAAMDNEIAEELVPQALRERITGAYIPTHPTIAQPVVRVPLTIYCIQDTLMIDEMPHKDNAQAGAPPVAGAPTVVPGLAAQPSTMNSQQMAQILINVNSLKQSITQNHQQLQNSLASLREWSVNQFISNCEP